MSARVYVCACSSSSVCLAIQSAIKILNLKHFVFYLLCTHITMLPFITSRMFMKDGCLSQQPDNQTFTREAGSHCSVLYVSCCLTLAPGSSPHHHTSAEDPRSPGTPTRHVAKRLTDNQPKAQSKKCTFSSVCTEYIAYVTLTRYHKLLFKCRFVA